MSAESLLRLRRPRLRSRRPVAVVSAALMVFLAFAALSGARTNAVSRIVFSSNRTGAWALYTMALDGTDIRPLISSAPGGDHPAWSTNGRTIAYEANDGESPTNTLWVIGADGSNPHELVDWHGRDFEPSWSSDSRKLVVVHNGSLVTMNADGSGQVVLGRGVAPAWSPDGRTIAFVRGTALWTVRPDGSHSRLLRAFTGGLVSGPAWSSDSSEIVVSAVGAAHRGDLFLVRSDGTPIRRLTSTRFQNETAVSWAPSMNIAFTEGRGTYRIGPSGGTPRLMITHGYDAAWGPGGLLAYVTQDTTGSHIFITGGGHGVRALATGADVEHPVWSSDGSKIAFVDGGKVVTVAADGSGLTVTAASVGEGLTWSPDGNEIAVASGTTLSVLRPDGSVVWTTQLAAPTPGDPRPNFLEPAWSPSGSTIVVPAVDYGGTSRIYSFPAAGGAARLILDSGQYESPSDVSISPDGLQLAFSASAGSSYVIAVAKVDGTAPTTLYTLPPTQRVTSSTTWTPDGARILFSATITETTEEIFTIRAAGGTPTRLTQPPGSSRAPNV